MDLEGANETASEAARDAVAMLVRSWNRLKFLEALVVEPPTRADLTVLAEVSRVAFSRILAAFEPRGTGEEG